jgi:hypothetical protein
VNVSWQKALIEELQRVAAPTDGFNVHELRR